MIVKIILKKYERKRREITTQNNDYSDGVFFQRHIGNKMKIPTFDRTEKR